MSNKQLILWASEWPDMPLKWFIGEEGRLLEDGEVSALSDIQPSMCAGLSVVLVLPGERFAMRMVETPAKTKKQIEQSAKFILEDELAIDMERSHLVLAERGEGAHQTIIVDQDYLQAWVNAFQECGLELSNIYADFQCFEGAQEKPTLISFSGRSIYADGSQGFVAEKDFVKGLLPSVLHHNETNEIDHYFLSGDPDLFVEGVKTNPIRINNERELSELLMASIEKVSPINLLQGAFEPGIDWSSALKPWRHAAYLAAACVTVMLVGFLVEGLRLNSQAKNIEQQAEQAFMAAYPDVTIRNLRAQARQLAGSGGSAQSDFLWLGNLVSSSIEQTPAVSLSQMTYSEDNRLTIDVEFADTEDLDAFKNKLIEQGAGVEEGRSINQVGSLLSGKLIVWRQA